MLKVGNILRRDKNFKYLFLSMLFMTAGSFLIESIFLLLLKGPVPFFVRPLSSVISLILFSLFLKIYLEKTREFDRIREEKFLNSLLRTVWNVFLVIFSYLIYSWAAIKLLNNITKFFEKGGLSYILLILFIIITLLLFIMIYSALILFTLNSDYNLKIFEQGKMYLKILLKSLRHPISYFTGFIVFYLLIILSSFLLSLLEKASNYITPYGFIENLLNYTILSIVYAFLFRIVVDSDRKLFRMDHEKIVEGLDKAKVKLPIFPIAVVIVSALILIDIYPMKLNNVDNYLTMVKEEMNRADIYGSAGDSVRSIAAYDKAYSRLNAIKAYITGIEGIRNKRGELQSEANRLFEDAKNLDPKNPYTYYFMGNLNFIKGSENPTASLKSYETAVKAGGGIPEAYLGILRATKKDNKERAKETLNLLVDGEIFYDRFYSIISKGDKTLDKYLDKIKELEDVLGPKMVYKSAEKMKYNNYYDASNELLSLREKYPTDPLINYYLALAYNGNKNEGGNYGRVKEYTDMFAEQYDTSNNPELNKNKLLFKYNMEYDINDMEGAEKTLREIYTTYPEDLYASSQYAYIFVKNKKFDEGIKVAKEVISKDKDNYFAYYTTSMAYLNTKNYNASITDILKFIEITSGKKELYPELDKYIYAYSLAFSSVYGEEAALKEVESLKKDDILYNYLTGIKAWRDKDNNKAQGYISKVVSINKELGYAQFVLGVNAYEESIRTNSTDFSKAEKYYLESIKYDENNAEAYFALGHCYKKWGKNKEALRAFRKVVDLKPYEDHRTDPYGITVHAIGEVSNLSQYDDKEGR